MRNEVPLDVAAMVAVLPMGTDAVIVPSVDAVPPLIVTEHQVSKFRTVSVALVPPSDCPPSDPPSAGGAPVSPLDAPLELLLEPPPELLLLLLEPPPELLVDTPLELPPPSSPDVVGGDELLLHATAPATASAAMLPTPSQSLRFIVFIVKASISRAFWPDN
jgi:hypothetical protein